MIPLMEDPGGGGVHDDPSGPMDYMVNYVTRRCSALTINKICSIDNYIDYYIDYCANNIYIYIYNI